MFINPTRWMEPGSKSVGNLLAFRAFPVQYSLIASILLLCYCWTVKVLHESFFLEQVFVIHFLRSNMVEFSSSSLICLLFLHRCHLRVMFI